jgi:hypothetical protein
MGQNTDSQNLRYRADLSETTLPEMLYTIDRFRVPGVIEARSEGVVKQVFVRAGYVVHASSTDRRDSLGDHLLRSGRITEKELERLTRERMGSNRKFGELLIESGALSPAEVFGFIREHVEDIVWSMFYWQSGEVVYGMGDLQEDGIVQIQLPIGKVIVEGIQRAPDAKLLLNRLGSKETVLEPCFKSEELIEISLDAEAYRLLRLVDGKRSLYDLCSQGPKAPAENAKLLYAFRVLHLVRRQQESRQTGPVKIQIKSTGDSYKP